MSDKAAPSPEANNVSSRSNPAPMLDEAAKRALGYYLAPKPEAKKKPTSNQLFTVAEGIDAECLLANLSETLASANAIIGDLAFDLDGSRRRIALAVQQLIELSELLANRVLDEGIPVTEA